MSASAERKLGSRLRCGPARWAKGALLGIFLLAGGAEPAGAQELPAVQRSCAQEDPSLVAPCRELALAADGIRAGLGILSAHGSPVPGTASTLGRRLGAMPRIAMSVRTTGTGLRLPDLEGDPAAPEERLLVVPSAQVAAGFGAVDGFRLAPTVGGILSADVLGTANVMRLPSSRGFSGSALSYGGGVRVGLLRESFTLPGISFSFLHHRGTQVRYGTVWDDGREVRVTPAVTSLRVLAGKDFLAFGVSAGVGWDRYGGEVETRVLDPSGEGADLVRSSEPPPVERMFLFGGATFTFLVLQLSGEAGWLPGPGEEEPRSSGFDPSRGSLFGSVSLRLTY